MGLRGMNSIFAARDIKKTSDFYVEKLGFRAVEYLNCSEPHICLYKDDAEIILIQANTDKIIPNRILYGYGFDTYIYTSEQDILYEQYKQKNVKFAIELCITDYQNKHFVVEDIDGRWIAFGLKENNK